ncbi:MAG: HlyD family type I secretion periplasmic adaptor subunit [Sphingomonas adhaesiva]|uniref:HlyD family type I secretion periplasmic adaptor subunit n=1 Tax=Sphingomonas adhaesiva TaxID=28212 RepID=UPI002FFCE1FF
MTARTTWRDRWDALDGTRRIILVTGVGFFLLLLWAALAPIDEVTRGEGRVIPSSKVQVVQASEASSVRQILVRSGQQVKKGQLLVRMDDTESAAARGQIEAERQSLAARSERLAGEVSGRSADCPPGTPQSLCNSEAQLADLRAATLRSKLSGLGSAIEQRRRELGEAQATVASLRSSVALAQKNVDMLAPLAAKSIVPQTELLAAQRDVNDQRGRLAAAQQTVSRAMAAVREAQAQASEANLQFRQEALNEQSQLNAKIAVSDQSLRGATGKLARSEIRSPLAGVVNDVQVTTIGAFLNPGQKIMEVVPLGDRLLVETRVTPKDIAFIKVGDAATVKVTAYDFSIYGGLDARVVQVSPDSIYDEVKREPYFSVMVETRRSYLTMGDRRLPITPGMLCDVEIVTGHKTVLSYLLKPVLKARSEALREK